MDSIDYIIILLLIISLNTYHRWQEEYVEAKSSLVDREDKIMASAEKIEKNLILLGCTAIEDKLQNNVPTCIENLAKAGIALWILTGDKMVGYNFDANFKRVSTFFLSCYLLCNKAFSANDPIDSQRIIQCCTFYKFDSSGSYNISVKHTYFCEDLMFKYCLYGSSCISLPTNHPLRVTAVSKSIVNNFITIIFYLFFNLIISRKLLSTLPMRAVF